MEELAQEMTKTISMEQLKKIAEQAEDLPVSKVLEEPANVEQDAPRIAVARDEAFCFYYEDNLRMLREEGAELV